MSLNDTRSAGNRISRLTSCDTTFVVAIVLVACVFCGSLRCEDSSFCAPHPVRTKRQPRAVGTIRAFSHRSVIKIVLPRLVLQVCQDVLMLISDQLCFG